MKSSHNEKKPGSRQTTFINTGVKKEVLPNREVDTWKSLPPVQSGT
jgi:hypothetical protein